MAAWWPNLLKTDEEEKVGGVLHDLIITPFSSCKRYCISFGRLKNIICWTFYREPVIYLSTVTRLFWYLLIHFKWIDRILFLFRDQSWQRGVPCLSRAATPLCASQHLWLFSSCLWNVASASSGGGGFFCSIFFVPLL